MKKQAKVSGTWQSGRNEIKVNLPIIIFEESNTTIMYCPALDVQGYGKDESEARESFKVSLGEFFLYTLNKKTLISELERMGWNIRKSKMKPMLPPPMTHLLENNDNFSRIFNNYSFRKVDESVAIPC
jgi:hypothetical protein